MPQGRPTVAPWHESHLLGQEQIMPDIRYTEILVVSTTVLNGFKKFLLLLALVAAAHAKNSLRQAG